MRFGPLVLVTSLVLVGNANANLGDLVGPIVGFPQEPRGNLCDGYVPPSKTDDPAPDWTLPDPGRTVSLKDLLRYEPQNDPREDLCADAGQAACNSIALYVRASESLALGATATQIQSQARAEAGSSAEANAYARGLQSYAYGSGWGWGSSHSHADFSGTSVAAGPVDADAHVLEADCSADAHSYSQAWCDMYGCSAYGTSYSNASGYASTVRVDVLLGGATLLSADVLHTYGTIDSTCTGSQSSRILRLKVGAYVDETVAFPPNTVLGLSPTAYAVVNEQSPVGIDGLGRCNHHTAALHVYVTEPITGAVTGEVVVSWVHVAATRA